MEQIVNGINFFSTIEEDTWRNILETDYQGARSTLLVKDDYIKFISSIAPVIRLAVFQLNGWEKYEDIPEKLPNQFCDQIRVLRLLKEFSSRLNKSILLRYFNEYLEEKGLLEVVQSTGEAKRILLILLLKDDLSVELLQQLLLISKYERFGYQDYTLIMDLENIEDPLIQAKLSQIEAKGFDNPEITAKTIDAILQGYEESNKTGLNSLCLMVTFYNNEFVIFILRESQRGGLRTFEEFIVGMNADLIVLRFSANLKELKVRAIESVKEEVYQEVANKIVKSINPDVKPKYIRSSVSNSDTVITGFLQSLLNEEVTNVSLHSIDISNCPLPGRPSMSFVKTAGHITLSESLGYQGDGQEQTFLRELITQSEIKKIKVSFLLGKGTHIFTFKLRRIGEVTYVLVNGQGGGIGKRQLLMELLNRQTAVRILESKD
ncbi:hypothetical protein GVV68_01440 (plasmid) [Bacillus cereus]|uniref:hypothetical protein n=1 Tax=Bacillus cereus group TaxID=86661 RepID=UPI000B44986E|nr:MULTISPECIES: hypothetical protein [Bacillus cereus group]OTW84062.1 hypothetical protein BK713_09155 [Bacillus thuringiensis serovar jinghongiensis]OTX19166.1 hypothetical protein BK715_08960 [Bacillus thuringiensis serovar japonensis]WBO70262.1 hypothetical protein GVV68_01440 [Bacillus cereus]